MPSKTKTKGNPPIVDLLDLDDLNLSDTEDAPAKDAPTMWNDMTFTVQHHVHPDPSGMNANRLRLMSSFVIRPGGDIKSVEFLLSDDLKKVTGICTIDHAMFDATNLLRHHALNDQALAAAHQESLDGMWRLLRKNDNGDVVYEVTKQLPEDINVEPGFRDPLTNFPTPNPVIVTQADPFSPSAVPMVSAHAFLMIAPEGPAPLRVKRY